VKQGIEGNGGRRRLGESLQSDGLKLVRVPVTRRPHPSATSVAEPTRRPGRARARILIGIADLGFHQEVLDFLERHPRVEVAGTAVDPERLQDLLSGRGIDAAVVCPDLLRALRPDIARPSEPDRREDAQAEAELVLLAQEMTVPVLREAIDLGVDAALAWPDERIELSHVLERYREAHQDTGPPRGRVIAVMGARGGVGTTFVATHLAATLADRGRRTVVVDLDTQSADVSVALGVLADGQAKTIADLAPVAEELSPEHVSEALWRHPRGFSALLAPQEAGAVVPGGVYAASIALLAAEFDAVLLHVPRPSDQLTRAGIALSHDVLLVTTLDLFSLHGARRLLTSAGLDQSPGRCRVVVNKVARSEITCADVQRVLGIAPFARIRLDSSVKRVQDRGQLLASRARRAGKGVRRLTDLLSDALPAAASVASGSER
jgi:pilus assembly protein CpaE